VILSIDPGRTTGFAFSDRTTGTYTPRRGDDGEAIWRWMGWLADLLDTRPIKQVVIERPFLRGVADADFTLSLAKLAHAVAFSRDIPRAEYPATTWRPMVFGKGVWGRLPKSPAARDRFKIAEAINLGWSVQTDHEADAALMLEAHLGTLRGAA